MAGHIHNHKKHKNYAKQQLDFAIKEALGNFIYNPNCRSVFQQLLLHVQTCTGLLNVSIDRGRQRWEAAMFIRGLQHLALHHENFIRPIHAWQPGEEKNRRVFASLVRHLLAEYDTPMFLQSAWLGARSARTFRQQEWHIKISRGHSIRRLNIPVQMTRKMEHLFLKCPDHFTVEEAMRYSQVLAFGGTKTLAKAVLAARLGRDIENDDFWRTVIHFFINSPELETSDVNPIVDFLYHTKLDKKEVFTNTGIVYLDPPDPGFSMKGRTFFSIMRLVEKWHKELALTRNSSSYSWNRQPISEFRFLEQANKAEKPHCLWTITELLNGSDLNNEGRSMRNCVQSYSSDCSRGLSSIWSMRMEFDKSIKRVLTIEVNPLSRTIIQARARCNMMPGKKAFGVMSKWAKKEGLRIGEHL
ncbi:MAG: hypothetical protein GY754_43335 [bacterium]|nr:hypothetical protein [bacterium]